MSIDSFVQICEKFGDRFDPEVLGQTIAHWAPRVVAHSSGGQEIDDIVYGEHQRHRLDVFPAAGKGGAPIVLFVHGGGFVSGDKQVSPVFYSNVGKYFASHGMVGTCMNYRLAPTGGWPAAAQDLERAVAWLLERGDLYGGDPRRLTVIGQSAGACHVATWLFDPTMQGGSQEKIAAAVLMSGFYEASEPLTPGQKAYFGDDSAVYALRSPLTHAGATSRPTLITCAEHDPAYLRRQSRDLHVALSESPHAGRLVDFPGHNHVSPLMSLGSDDDTVGAVLREFITAAVTT
jgi:triacylglycerol lipase